MGGEWIFFFPLGCSGTIFFLLSERVVDMELVEFSDRSLDVGGRTVGNLAPAVIHTHMYI